ncbi:uncharacterized protein RSE6_12766 [Rhynchosporium secalis]|uniref:Uncharacterized protein n=1 Tax=Rhynchosporium secalis TaxID=38038 RepID=A0A1E1MR97_RHYSE|nr:uncharacterized protein RSE6_12766 [Rhynchosporium secalis]
MSFESNSSSLRAQNGSAYGESSDTHDNSTNRQFPPPPQRQLSDSYTGGYIQHDRNTTGSTTVHQDYSPAQQNTNYDQVNGSDERYKNARIPADGSTSWGQYSSSTEQYTTAPTPDRKPPYLPVYNPGTPRYANELDFDEARHNAAATTQRPQTPTYGGYYQQALAQNNAYQHQNGLANQPMQPESPTTERWNTTICTEERLRLGIPRYASEEERCRAYENAADPRCGH